MIFWKSCDVKNLSINLKVLFYKLFFYLSIYIQGGPKKFLWCDLEEKWLRNSKIFFNGVFLYIYSHLLKNLELSKLCRKLLGSKNGMFQKSHQTKKINFFLFFFYFCYQLFLFSFFQVSKLKIAIEVIKFGRKSAYFENAFIKNISLWSNNFLVVS